MILSLLKAKMEWMPLIQLREESSVRNAEKNTTKINISALFCFIHEAPNERNVSHIVKT